jgi:hypothetical protein
VPPSPSCETVWASTCGDDRALPGFPPGPDHVERTRSPPPADADDGTDGHASVVDPDLPDLVERWIDEAVADIEDGLTAGGRLEPHQRRFRGALAMAQLDYVTQHRDGSDWKIGRDQMLEELGASRVRLLN